MTIRLPAMRLSPALASTTLFALLLLSVVAGHEGRRVAQVLALALPVLLWLRLPLASRGWRAARFVGVVGVVTLFLVDGAVRGLLQQQYGAAPDSSLVLAAVANTSWREAFEYAASQHVMLALAGGALALAVAAVMALAAVSNRHQAPLSTRSRAMLAVLLLVCVAGLVSKPWRRHHPLVFWPEWMASVQALHQAWSDQQLQRDALMANARAAGARATGPDASTVVLVLTDSVNRDNMSLYGYPRETTPQLAALQAEERGRLLTLRHAWSVQAGTMAALSGLFSFGKRDEDDPVHGTQHVLALARAAGYRIWWMSNHDDVAIEQQHARLADTVEMINREPGRDTTNLDGELLDCLEEALVDPTPRKLIVVHLLGAHPHYRLRAPRSLALFPAAADAVDAEMTGEGRPAWLRAMRRDYDTAIRYHDGVVAGALRLTRRHTPANGRAAWMFLSDHGQEVGHDISHAGHSPGTLAGYRIPALLWRSNAPFNAEVGRRPFRSDWGAWTLADLMGLTWQGMSPRHNILDPGYAWAPPQLQVQVADFSK